MGEAKRRGSRETRVAEGIFKEQQRRLELDRQEFERMRKQPRLTSKSKQVLGMALGIAASSVIKNKD